MTSNGSSKDMKAYYFLTGLVSPTSAFHHFFLLLSHSYEYHNTWVFNGGSKDTDVVYGLAVYFFFSKINQWAAPTNN